jgi:hypothetical protein
METKVSQTQFVYGNFISGQKCVLLDTIYAILLLRAQDTSDFGSRLHRMAFVTGLYLDKASRLWQYIVEVDAS